MRAVRTGSAGSCRPRRHGDGGAAGGAHARALPPFWGGPGRAVRAGAPSAGRGVAAGGGLGPAPGGRSQLIPSHPRRRGGLPARQDRPEGAGRSPPPPVCGAQRARPREGPCWWPGDAEGFAPALAQALRTAPAVVQLSNKSVALCFKRGAAPRKALGGVTDGQLHPSLSRWQREPQRAALSPGDSP